MADPTRESAPCPECGADGPWPNDDLCSACLAALCEDDLADIKQRDLLRHREKHRPDADGVVLLADPCSYCGFGMEAEDARAT